MARKGKFGQGTPTDYAGNVLKRINEMNATGETAAPAGTTDGTAASKTSSSTTRVGTGQLRQNLESLKPDYSGLDFTGLDKNAINKLKKTRWTPEYVAARKALKERKKEFMTPYTQEQIQKDPALRAIASGITLEQAIASYRQLVKAMNATPLEGQTLSAAKSNKLRRLNASLTPQQKASQRIIGLLGGYGAEPSGRSPFTGETWLQGIYRRLGMSDKVPTGTLQSPETYTIDPKFGPIIKIPNPLTAQQKSRLQRLRAIAPGARTKKQQTVISRLLNKKNAPITVNPEE